MKSAACYLLLLSVVATAIAQTDEATTVRDWVRKHAGKFTHHTSVNGGPGYEIVLSRQTTDADLKEFLALKPSQLWDLNLGPCRQLSASAVQELSHLPKLEILRVPVATTDAGVQHIATALPNLRVLILQESKVTDAGLPPLAKLTHLTRLNLAATAVTDACWKELATFPALEELSLMATRVKGTGLKQLAALKGLRALNLTSTAVGDEVGKELAHLTDLRELSLRQRPVGDGCMKALAGLTELRELQLYGTAVTDGAIDDLSRLTKLEAIFLERSRVTLAGANKLQKALPKCRVVR